MEKILNTKLKTDNQWSLTPLIYAFIFKVTILFITHQLPKGLQVDEAVVLGKNKVDAKPKSRVEADLNVEV